MKEDLIVPIMKDMCGELYGYKGENNRNLKRYAENLANANYRKIPDGAVVISKDEYYDLIDKSGMNAIKQLVEISDAIESVRKKTATAIFEKLREKCMFDGYPYGVDYKEICETVKDYGVEVEE